MEYSSQVDHSVCRSLYEWQLRHQPSRGEMPGSAVSSLLRPARLRAHASKLHWGIQAVGLPATLQGLTRSVALRIRRPATARTPLPYGAVMDFDYPSQLVPALVVFGDLI